MATSSPTGVPGGKQTIRVPVKGGDNDAEEQNGHVDTTSGDLEMAKNQERPQIVGIRFTNVNIPAGATITKAYIQFVADSNQNESTNLQIAGQVGNAANAFSGSNKISTRPLTAGRTSWSNVPAWQAGQSYQTPNLAAVVQEIVNGGGWSNGDAMAFVISGSGKRAAISYNKNARKGPVLVIEYMTGGGTPGSTSTPLPTSAPTGTPVPTGTVVPTGTPIPTGTSVPTATATPGSTSVPGGKQTISVPVIAGDDDAEEQNGRVNNYSGDLEMAKNEERLQIVGIRFQHVGIPAGATITNAYIQFVADSNQNESTNLQIAGQAGNAANAFSRSNAISSRPLTNQHTNWSNVPAWQAGQSYQTPDLTAVVQEIVNGSWSSGDAMAFVISGSGKRAAVSYNKNAGKAPVLVVEYTTGGAATSQGTTPASTESLQNSIYLAIVASGEPVVTAQGASVEGADVQSADVQGADVQGADVQGVDVQGVDVQSEEPLPHRVYLSIVQQ